MGGAETIFAALTLAVCVVLLVRLCVGPARRWRFDQAVSRAARAASSRGKRLLHWRTSPRAAARAPDEAIHRARGGVDREGNVYRPRDFRRPRKPH